MDRRIDSPEKTLASSEQEAATHLDDLDEALSLMTIMSRLCALMPERQRVQLLPTKEFESLWVQTPISDVETFLSSL